MTNHEVTQSGGVEVDIQPRLADSKRTVLTLHEKPLDEPNQIFAEVFIHEDPENNTPSVKYGWSTNVTTPRLAEVMREFGSSYLEVSFSATKIVHDQPIPNALDIVYNGSETPFFILRADGRLPDSGEGVTFAYQKPVSALGPGEVGTPDQQLPELAFWFPADYNPAERLEAMVTGTCTDVLKDTAIASIDALSVKVQELVSEYIDF